jgi:hypothetical protein
MKPDTSTTKKLKLYDLMAALKLASITLQLVSDSGLLSKGSKSKKALAYSSLITEAVVSVTENANSVIDSQGIQVDPIAASEILGSEEAKRLIRSVV